MAIFNPAAVLIDQQPSPWGELMPIVYDQRDVLLYAVGIGLHSLRFTYEGHPQFAVFPPLPSVGAAADCRSTARRYPARRGR